MNRWNRAEQVFRYFQSKFPTPLPVRFRWVPKLAYGADEVGVSVPERRRGYDGTVYLWKGQLYLELSRKSCTTWHATIHTLMHEYAHAMTWRHWPVEKHREHHDDEFWLALGRVYRDFIDEDGHLESRNY